jgi:hypothetical protein
MVYWPFPAMVRVPHHDSLCGPVDVRDAMTCMWAIYRFEKILRSLKDDKDVLEMFVILKSVKDLLSLAGCRLIASKRSFVLPRMTNEAIIKN